MKSNKYQNFKQIGDVYTENFAGTAERDKIKGRIYQYGRSKGFKIEKKVVGNRIECKIVGLQSAKPSYISVKKSGEKVIEGQFNMEIMTRQKASELYDVSKRKATANPLVSMMKTLDDEECIIIKDPSTKSMKNVISAVSNVNYHQKQNGSKRMYSYRRLTENETGKPAGYKVFVR